VHSNRIARGPYNGNVFGVRLPGIEVEADREYSLIDGAECGPEKPLQVLDDLHGLPQFRHSGFPTRLQRGSTIKLTRFSTEGRGIAV
jgi:hypothetical protein